MKFANLNDPTDSVSFEQALQQGLGRNNGLYFPKHIPLLTENEVSTLAGASRQQTARVILGKWLEDEVPRADLEKIIAKASTFETPVVSVGDKKVLELFHGPTMAFKDVAARYLAALTSYFNRKNDRYSTVLVATSGDTGGAIAHGFGNIDRVSVVVLYPKGRVSRLQQDQLRRVAPNVQTLEVNGSFDDCQLLVKQALSDEELSNQLNLTSANSINIGRLLPQSTYYAFACGQLGRQTGRFVVPSGNLGNLTGGMLAHSMGVPIPGFLAATNANDAFVQYMKTNLYQPAASQPTISNAMDVGAPNNISRIISLLNLQKPASVTACKVSDTETVTTIKQVYNDTGYLLDPHTAVAWSASDSTPSLSDHPDVIVATASPLKFAEEIFKKTGIKIDNTKEIESLHARPERYIEIDNSIDKLKQILKGVH